MSPEQAEGKAIDARSDLFSLGIVLYEMLTGERPFKGDSSVSVISSILKDTPRAIAEVNAGVPRELSQVVRRCLVKDADKRLQSAKDLRNELEEVKQSIESGELASFSSVAGSTVTAVPSRTARWSLDRRWPAGIALGVLLVAGAAAWRYWPTATESGDPSRTAASFAILTTQSGVEQHPSLSPDGRWMVYASDAAGNLDVYLQGVGAQTPINLTKDSPAPDNQPAFSPDGERIAFRSGRDGGGLFVMGRTGELAKKVIDRGFNPAWSPDGQQLAFSTQSVTANPGSRGAAAELWAVTVSTGESRRLTASDGMQPAWSPDGARIAYWGWAHQTANREIWTITATGGDPTRITDHPAVDWNPVWAPDGRHLYFGSDRGGSLGLWRIPVDASSGLPAGPAQSVPLPATLAAHFSLSADGSRMVFASYQLSRQVYSAEIDPQTAAIGSTAPLTRGTRTWAYMDLSDDGGRLVMTTAYPQEDVFSLDATGENLRQITSDVSLDRDPDWMPDGRIVYFSGQPGEIMHFFTMAADGSDRRQITRTVPAGGNSWVLPIASPDGSRIAAYNLGGGPFLLEPTAAGDWTPTPLPPVGAAKEIFRPAVWFGDGRRILGVTVETGHLVVYDVDGRTYDETGLRGFSGQLRLPWLQDGRRLLAIRGGSIVMVDLTSRQVSTVVTPPARQSITRVAFSPVGRRLFYILQADESDIALMTMK